MNRAISQCFVQAQTLGELYNLLGAKARDFFEAESFDVLWQEDDGSLLLVGSSHNQDVVERLRLGRGAGLSGQALASGIPVCVTSGLKQHRADAKVPFMPDEDFESAVALPIIGSASYGSIVLRRTTTWMPSEDELLQLARFGSQIAFAWEGYLLGQNIGKSQEAKEVIQEVTESLTGSPYLEEILQHLVHFTARRFNYAVVTVRLLDTASSTLVLRATQSTNKAYMRKPALHMNESIAGQVMSSNKSITVLDVQTDESYIGHDLAEEQGLRSLLCVPLAVHDRSIGVMTCYTHEKRQFPADEIKAVESLAKQAALSIDHARMMARSTLMQEMHHRVKNNLQQVASLLRLQIRQEHYKSLEEALNDTLSRILAIAQVHELLSREDLDHVSLLSIAENLVIQFKQSVVPATKKIAFSVKGEHMFLSTGQATQVALVLNELILNAIEHGFAKSDTGEIEVTLWQNESGSNLVVRNSGDRLPAEFNVDKGNLGLQIVNSLSRALGGSLEINQHDEWVVAQVTFSPQAGD